MTGMMGWLAHKRPRFQTSKPIEANRLSFFKHQRFEGIRSAAVQGLGVVFLRHGLLLVRVALENDDAFLSL